MSSRDAAAADTRPLSIILRAGIVGLTLATAAIHASLGGQLFLLSALGYVVLAVAMLAPGPLALVRWLVRLALIGYAATTIAAWLMIGPRFSLAYVDKAIEAALLALLAAELARDGGASGVVRRLRRLARGFADAFEVSARA